MAVRRGGGTGTFGALWLLQVYRSVYISDPQESYFGCLGAQEGGLGRRSELECKVRDRGQELVTGSEDALGDPGVVPGRRHPLKEKMRCQDPFRSRARSLIGQENTRKEEVVAEGYPIRGE